MMGVSRADAMQMSLWEYEARLWHWNDAHSDGAGDIDLPDPKAMMAMIDRINSDPRLTH